MALLDQFDGDVPVFIMTDTEPMRCINCDEEEWAYNKLETDGTSTWREIGCEACGTTWNEVLDIRSITNIEIGGLNNG